MDEQQTSPDLKNDSKYKRYVGALEKCLQSFESVNEWADVISFLSRLGKVFSSFPTFKEIPFKLNLAKRLAQCLNPALPAGVHQKTLEVYEMVFRKIGNENLVKDLSIYAFGLFPFFEHSATLVKNSLLELYEVYLVPLGTGLIPSLRPLVLSIILGLEEESSEHFTKVNNLLNRIKSAVGNAEFYDAIWTGLLISPHHRLAIVNFLLKNIHPNSTNQELSEICVNNTKLVASALSAALQDPEQLVARGSLEILLKHFPIEKRFFETQQLTELFQASMCVLTRKDMSLTRRFYTWILTTGASETETLSDYSLNILILAMNAMINADRKTAEDFSKPFKLLVFLLDKPIVSDPLLNDCLFSLIESLMLSSKKLPEEDFLKVMNSANFLFRMLELNIIWGSFTRKAFSIDFSDVDLVQKSVETILFAVDRLFIFDESTSMFQAHVLIFSFIDRMSQNASIKAVNLCFTLIQTLIDKLDIVLSYTGNIGSEGDLSSYCSALAASLSDSCVRSEDTDDSTLPRLLIMNTQSIIQRSSTLINSETLDVDDLTLFKSSNSLLLSILSKLGPENALVIQKQSEKWLEFLLSSMKSSSDLDYIEIGLNQIKEMLMFCYDRQTDVRETLIGCTIPWLWSKYCSEPTGSETLGSLMSSICRLFPNESDIFYAQVLSDAIRNGEYVVVEKFSQYWDSCMSLKLLENVPLRISIVVLTDFMTKNEYRHRKCSYLWIYSLTKNLDRFLVPSLSSFAEILECGLNDSSNSSSGKKTFRGKFDKGPLIFYLNVIQRLLDINFEDATNYLSITEIDPEFKIHIGALIETIKNHLNVEFDIDNRINYFNLLIILCLPLIAMEEQSSKNSLNSPVRVPAINLLHSLLKCSNSNSLPLIRILFDFSSFKLNFFVCNSFEMEKQMQFLRIFDALLSNSLILPTIASNEAEYLIETCKAAISTCVDSDLMHFWVDYTISLSLLPSSSIELIIDVVIDSLISRLTNRKEFNLDIDPSVISSILISTTKMVVFYLAAKSNLFSGNIHLKSSVSCLLNEVKTEGINALSTFKLSSSINIADFVKIFDSFYFTNQLISEKISSDQENSDTWFQTAIVLKDACSLIYSTNMHLATETLISVFMHSQESQKSFCFYSFMSMFYGNDAVEFYKSSTNFFKSAKDGWKNQDVLLKFILEFTKNDSDPAVNLEIWSTLVSIIKEICSSGFKSKVLLGSLIVTLCSSIEKIYVFEPSKISKDFESVFKLIDYSILYAAKLNESHQWISKADDIVDIKGQRFGALIFESVKDKNVGKCMISICQTLIPLMSKSVLDSDKLTSIMTSIIINFVNPNLKSSSRNSLMGQIASYSLDSALDLNLSSIKAWKRDLWEAFFDNSFLWMPKFYFKTLTKAFKIITQEPDRYCELLGKFASSATASMFLSKDAEVLSKALNIRRLSFLTFWGGFDAFRIHLPSLQEKLVELTRYYNGFILGEIFFLVRIFLLRLSDESISSLWPLIMTELVQLFESCTKVDNLLSADLYALFQACKLIDMMLTLRTSSILLYHWLFFDSSGKEGLFIRVKNKMSSSSSVASVAYKNIEDNTSRRPLLHLSSIKDSYELSDFLSNAWTHLSHDFVMIQNLDMDFINSQTEKDLVEMLEIK